MNWSRARVVEANVSLMGTLVCRGSGSEDAEEWIKT